VEAGDGGRQPAPPIAVGFKTRSKVPRPYQTPSSPSDPARAHVRPESVTGLYSTRYAAGMSLWGHAPEGLESSAR
jgi:hypothetical protein